jgi:hypothetical protein
MALLSAKELKAVVVELSGGEKAAVAIGYQSAFCKGWPMVKTTIEVIAQTSNTWVKICCRVVLMVGNALYKKCPVA